MNQCTLASSNLPLNFTYYFSLRDKIEVVETILSRKYVLYDYDKTDVTINWTLDYTTNSWYNTFRSYFTNRSIITFKDYDGKTWSVLLKRFDSKEEKGFYSLSGEFVVVET